MAVVPRPGLAGMKLGENWRELGKYFHKFDAVTGIGSWSAGCGSRGIIGRLVGRRRQAYSQ